jgi:type III pantothenate kinase
VISIDVGNSSVGVGIWEGGRVRVERVREPEEAVEALASRIACAAGSTCDAVVVSVSPPRLLRLQLALASRSLPAAHELSRPPVALAGSSPDLLASAGADRLANALVLLPGPGIVVDAGTAVTVDLVDRRGRYLGGFIAAGPAAAGAGLATLTSLLPRLPGQRVALVPGMTTQPALGAGLWGAAVGGVDRLVACAAEALGETGPVRVVATGGWGAAWAADSARQDIELLPECVHHGIALWAGGS